MPAFPQRATSPRMRSSPRCASRILADVPAVENLSPNGAFRSSDYDLTASAASQPTSMAWTGASMTRLAIRAQAQHAICAPNIGDLYGGQSSRTSRPSLTLARTRGPTSPKLCAMCVSPPAFPGDQCSPSRCSRITPCQLSRVATDLQEESRTPDRGGRHRWRQTESLYMSIDFLRHQARRMPLPRSAVERRTR